jgi:tRNA(Arg) A34 adenosine deaminase TadA
MGVSKKTQGYINLAIDVAKNAEDGKFQHGAVLVKGSSVRSTAYNKERFCSFGNRFRKRDHGHATLHAELGCILGKDRSVTTGSTVYVARVNRLGEPRMSKPCSMCEAALSHVGVKRVVYTTSNKKIESINL